MKLSMRHFCLAVSSLLVVRLSFTFGYPTKNQESQEETDDLARRHLRPSRRFERPNPKLCREYCSLYSDALERCPYEVPEEYAVPTKRGRCLKQCIQAPFSKSDPELSFASDSLQCRMNHARMAIKEGALTNSLHCIHASIGTAGTGRCMTDAAAEENEQQLAAGRYVFYNSNTLLPMTDPPVDFVLAGISFLIDQRARLYASYPYQDLTEDGKEINCSDTQLQRFRSSDGTCNNFDMPLMGAAGTSFTRNTKASLPHKDGDADITKVANILKRDASNVGLAPFNQLSVAWIQFMTHDWFQHDKTEGPGPSMRNKVTHWWDASQLYGSTEEEAAAIRAEGGKLHLDENNELDYDEFAVPKTGFTDNFWAGLHIMHTVFAREHNRIVDQLSAAYTMTDDEKYGTARNCIAAILAKIHTLEWTPTLLDNTLSTFGLNVNWYGLDATVKATLQGNVPDEVQATVDSVKVPHVLGGEFGTSLTLFNTSFFMTEEFVSVYRMHPLLPDEIDIDGTTRSLQEIVFNDAREIVENKEKTTEILLQAFGNTPARSLSLRNYPSSLYGLKLGEDGPTVNLAEIDIARDRERGIPRYNDARQQLLLQRYTSFNDLTDDVEELQLLESVYTDIDQVDFLVGCLVDKDRPEGFAFGAVPYYVFLVMASRRLLSDRFFQEDLTVENYTPFGINYIINTNFQDILKANFPQLVESVPSNPFSNEW